MKFVVKKRLYSYKCNIKGERIDKKYQYLIKLKKNIFYYFKDKIYLREGICYYFTHESYLKISYKTASNDNSFELTHNPSYATKYSTKEEALNIIKDIQENPNNYISL